MASLHLPPKATAEETESLLAEWEKMPVMQQQRLIVGFDCNETFDFEGDGIHSRTAWGECILMWAKRQNLPLPLQDGTTPSFFPYNPAQRPRRLDYILVRGLRGESEGEVLQKTRTMMGSDHDAVSCPSLILAPGTSTTSTVTNCSSAPQTGKSLAAPSPAHRDDLRMDPAHQRGDTSGEAQ